MGSLRYIVPLFGSLGLILFSTSSSLDASTAILVKVDQTGEGDFTRIQDAINVVPSNNTEPVFIWVKPGIYRFLYIYQYLKLYIYTLHAKFT